MLSPIIPSSQSLSPCIDVKQKTETSELEILKARIADLEKAKEEQEQQVQELAKRLTYKTNELDRVICGIKGLVATDEQARLILQHDQGRLLESSKNENQHLVQAFHAFLDYLKAPEATPELRAAVKALRAVDSLRMVEDLQARNGNKGKAIGHILAFSIQLAEANSQTKVHLNEALDRSKILTLCTREAILLPELLQKILRLNFLEVNIQDHFDKLKTERNRLQPRIRALLEHFIEKIDHCKAHGAQEESEQYRSFLQNYTPSCESQNRKALGENIQKVLTLLNDLVAETTKKWNEINFKLLEAEENLSIESINESLVSRLETLKPRAEKLLQDVKAKCTDFNGKYRNDLSEDEKLELINELRESLSLFKSTFGSDEKLWREVQAFLAKWKIEYKEKSNVHYYLQGLDREATLFAINQSYAKDALLVELKKWHCTAYQSFYEKNKEIETKCKEISSLMRPCAIYLDWIHELVSQNIYRILPIYPYNIAAPAGPCLSQWDLTCAPVLENLDDGFILIDDNPPAEELPFEKSN